jgi:drug/metabolite transporter (DMT)-like permease
MLKKFNSPVYALLGSSILWGIAGPIIKYTLNYIPPFSFLVLRFLIASLVLYFLVPWKKQNYLKNLGKIGFIKVFLLGILGSSVNLGLYFIALNQTSSIEGAIIYAMGPIFVFLGGIIFLKENVNKKEMLGFFITLIGFLIIIINPILGKNGSDIDKHLIGNIIMLFSAISWGAYAVLAKYYFNKDADDNFSPVFLTFITSFAGVITLLPFAFYEMFTTNIDYVAAIPGIFYMAIPSSVIAFFLYSYGVKKIEVSHVSFFEYLVPAITLPSSIIFLGEKFTYWYVVGFVLLAVGLYITERVPKHIKHLKKAHQISR